MKGIIFNLLEDYITSYSGEDEFEQLLQRCSLQTADPLLIVAPGTYPDADFIEIIKKAARARQISEHAFYHAFGRYAIPRIAERYPNFFIPFSHPKDFLKFTGMVHLLEVKKLYNDAQVPDFTSQDTGPDSLTLRYSSHRRLCHLVEGLIKGLAAYYRVKTSYRQTLCLLKGDRICEFHIRFQDHSGEGSADEKSCQKD